MTERETIEALTDDKTCLGTTKCDAITWTKLTHAMETAINAMMENQQYRAIGTVEECREAMERQRAKKPVEYEDKYYGCPVCDNVLLHKWKRYPVTFVDKRNGLPYCLSCGQAIDWSE